ncbi:MAG: hypothetical protein JWN30_2475 [Bacilli bacterium]|nr:hypothetical protein [Bacilli bacterium]
MRVKQQTASKALLAVSSFLTASLLFSAAAAAQDQVNASVNGHAGSGAGRLQHMQIQSSVQLPPHAWREAQEAALDAMQKKLKKYAKISATQADKVAEKEAPGTKIQRTTLQAVGPNLVYIVMLKNDTDRYLVVIDAGNGNVLDKRHLTPRPAPAPAPAQSSAD